MGGGKGNVDLGPSITRIVPHRRTAVPSLLPPISPKGALFLEDLQVLFGKREQLL